MIIATSITLAVLIGILVVVMLLIRKETHDLEDYARENEMEDFDWDIPDWSYIGTDVEMEDDDSEKN